MITKILYTVAFTFFICTAGLAGTVYKWNEDGKTIYSQTPPPPGVKFEIVIEEDLGKTTAVAKVDSNPGFDERQEQRKQDQINNKVLEESNRIKKENCDIARNNMQSLKSRGQVTIKEGDIYRKLTEEERQAKIQETQELVDEFC